MITVIITRKKLEITATLNSDSSAQRFFLAKALFHERLKLGIAEWAVALVLPSFSAHWTRRSRAQTFRVRRDDIYDGGATLKVGADNKEEVPAGLW